MALPQDRLLIADHDAARRLRMLAIGLMIAALAVFSLLDTTAKYLSAQHENPLQVAWLRYVFHVVFAAILLNPWTSAGVWKTKKPGLHSCVRCCSRVPRCSISRPSRCCNSTRQ